MRFFPYNECNEGRNRPFLRRVFLMNAGIPMWQLENQVGLGSTLKAMHILLSVDPVGIVA